MKCFFNRKRYFTNIIIFMFFPLLFWISDDIKLTLNGDKQITLMLNQKYKELGATAKKCNLLYCQNITKNIIIKSNIDTTKLGTYYVNYSFIYKGKKIDNKRKVIITEKEPPIIELTGQQKLKCQGKHYIEEGYKASDNYDGDITDKVIVKQKKDGIHYLVSDSAFNTTEVIRKRTYEDNEAPTISLKGDNIIYLEQGSLFKEPGYNAFDNCEGDLTEQVKINGKINNNTPGEYSLVYSIKDSLGNTSFIERKIIVYGFDTKSKKAYTIALEQYIKSKNYNVSLIYYNLNTKYTYKYNEKKVYYGASLIKTVAAMYAYENMELSDHTKELIKPMIERSNNKAFLTLENIIGFNNLKNYGLSLGAKYTLVGGDEFGDTTAEDQLIYWQHLYQLINSIELKDELKSYFINDYYRFLDFDESLEIMHKYGYYDSVFHDVGIVFDKEPYIIIILTEEGHNDYGSIISDLSQKIYKLNQLS